MRPTHALHVTDRLCFLCPCSSGLRLPLPHARALCPGTPCLPLDKHDQHENTTTSARQIRPTRNMTILKKTHGIDATNKAQLENTDQTNNTENSTSTKPRQMINSMKNMRRLPSACYWAYLRLCHLWLPCLVGLVGRAGPAGLVCLVGSAALLRRPSLIGAVPSHALPGLGRARPTEAGKQRKTTDTTGTQHDQTRARLTRPT